jgi:hypothetical protein
MSANHQVQSTRRVLWWARSFGRPLQATFTPDNRDTQDEFEALLEMADERLGESASHPRSS